VLTPRPLILVETDLFPFWRKHVSEPFRAGLATNVNQHHLFARPLDACWLYVRRLRPLLDAKAGVKTRPSPVPEPPEVVSAIDPAEFGLDISKPFDPAALRREMDKWVPHGSRHMQEEIETLRPEFFDSMGEKRYMESEGILVKHLQAMDPTWFLVSCIGEWARRGATSGTFSQPLRTCFCPMTKPPSAIRGPRRVVRLACSSSLQSPPSMACRSQPVAHSLTHAHLAASLPMPAVKGLCELPYPVRRLLVPVSRSVGPDISPLHSSILPTFRSSDLPTIPPAIPARFLSCRADHVTSQFMWSGKYWSFWKYTSHPEVSPLGLVATSWPSHVSGRAPWVVADQRQNLTFSGSA
jgi:hypothetical protein